MTALKSLHWVATCLVSLVLFLSIALTLVLAWEYIQLLVVEGDGGYPFGVEEAGPGYATKEIYMRKSAWTILLGTLFSATMLYGLFKRRPAITWIATLVSMAWLFILFASSST
jgi:hypothetical protein